jgi:hypothetical protein
LSGARDGLESLRVASQMRHKVRQGLHSNLHGDHVAAVKQGGPRATTPTATRSPEWSPTTAPAPWTTAGSARTSASSNNKTTLSLYLAAMSDPDLADLAVPEWGGVIAAKPATPWACATDDSATGTP